MILNSLILTGEKHIGYTLTSAEQTYWLAQLNAFMESWSLDRLMCYQILQESFSLVAGTASYTIGSGATFSTARPTKIVDPCFVRDSSSIDTQLQLISAEAYGSIVLKSNGNTYPRYLFYDSAFESELATIFLYPVPSASLTLYINSWKQLQTFASISTTLALPPGYQHAIETNFALYACLGSKEPSPLLVKVARDAKAAIRSLNIPDLTMTLPFINGVRRDAGQNIFTG